MSKSDYLWCLHCEKAYPRSWLKRGGYCPTFGCSGAGLGLDIYEWKPDGWPRVNHPEYPEVPEVGKEYPLY